VQGLPQEMQSNISLPTSTPPAIVRGVTGALQQVERCVVI